MSTWIGLDPIGKAEQFDKKEKKKITIDRRAIISEYNKFMGGVDLLDSLTALYKFPIKSRRWYMYIFLSHLGHRRGQQLALVQAPCPAVE